MTLQSRRRSLLGCVGLVAIFAQAAHAQGVELPLRIIVPYTAGGQTDAMARVLADSMRKTLQRNVIVENKPGAGGLIGMRAMQTAPADGDTLLMRDSGFVAAPFLQKAATYDPLKDLVPVAGVGRSDMFVMATRDSQIKTLPELFSYAKTQPGGVAFANPGLNTGSHMAAALLAKRSGVSIVHVPYKGSADTAAAMMSGDVKFQINVMTDALLGQVRAGNIRLIATVSSQASTFAPDTPTVQQSFPGYGFDGFFCLLAAPGTPPAKIASIAEAARVALADPAIREKFSAVQVTAAFKGPQELGQDIERQHSFYRGVVTELGLQPQ